MIATRALCAAVLCLPVALLQDRFEGTVTMRTAFVPDSHADIVITKKWPRERLDIASSKYGKATVMYDFHAGTRTVWLPAKKVYWREYIAQHAQRLRAAVEDPNYRPAPSGIIISPTNRTDTVAGHTCHYATVGADQVVDVCAATGLGQFVADKQIDGARALLGKSDADTAYDDLGSRFPGGYLPLKIVSRASTTPRTVLEVTRIQRMTVPDKTFDVPSSYQQIQPPE
jgi:hypothetical protein